jgi:hypothetical protein
MKKFFTAIIVIFLSATCANAQTQATQQQTLVPQIDTVCHVEHVLSVFPKYMPMVVMNDTKTTTVEKLKKKHEGYFVPIMLNGQVVDYKEYQIRIGEVLFEFGGTFYYSKSTGAHLVKRTKSEQTSTAGQPKQPKKPLISKEVGNGLLTAAAAILQRKLGTSIGGYSDYTQNGAGLSGSGY